MSMMGYFGLCSKSNYDSLINLLRNEQFGQAEILIKGIYSELKNSVEKLENDKCSGDVFIALFQYFKTKQEIDVKKSIESENLGKLWREATGDLDMAVFHEKAQFLSLEDTIDYDEISQFISDFFQADYKNAGQIACNVLLNNLKRTGTNSVLIWHLC